MVTMDIPAHWMQKKRFNGVGIVENTSSTVGGCGGTFQTGYIVDSSHRIILTCLHGFDKNSINQSGGEDRYKVPPGMTFEPGLALDGSGSIVHNYTSSEITHVIPCEFVQLDCNSITCTDCQIDSAVCILKNTPTRTDPSYDHLYSWYVLPFSEDEMIGAENLQMIFYDSNKQPKLFSNYFSVTKECSDEDNACLNHHCGTYTMPQGSSGAPLIGWYAVGNVVDWFAIGNQSAAATSSTCNRVSAGFCRLSAIDIARGIIS